MKKTFSISPLIAALFVVSACATTDSSNTESKYKMVDVTTAKMLHEQEALFVDVRQKSNFDQGHIPGAVNIPFPNFHDHTLAKVADKDQEVVFYCYGIHCPVSDKISNRALIWGYEKVYYFMRGYPAWLNAGYPVE